MIRLDDFLREQRIDRLRFWKLDVEYHEPEALAGASRILRAKAIDAILIELSHVTFDAVKAQLASVGYRLWRLDRRGLTRTDTLPGSGTYNLVAMPT